MDACWRKMLTTQRMIPFYRSLVCAGDFSHRLSARWPVEYRTCSIYIQAAAHLATLVTAVETSKVLCLRHPIGGVSKCHLAEIHVQSTALPLVDNDFLLRAASTHNTGRSELSYTARYINLDAIVACPGTFFIALPRHFYSYSCNILRTFLL